MQPNLQPIAKLLIFGGIVLVLLGGILYFSKEIPFLGKLPGDIQITRKQFSFYFPITSCIILSVILSVILYLFSRR